MVKRSEICMSNIKLTLNMKVIMWLRRVRKRLVLNILAYQLATK